MLVSCENCKAQVSDVAETCPACGHPQPKSLRSSPGGSCARCGAYNLYPDLLKGYYGSSQIEEAWKREACRHCQCPLRDALPFQYAEQIAWAAFEVLKGKAHFIGIVAGVAVGIAAGILMLLLLASVGLYLDGCGLAIFGLTFGVMTFFLVRNVLIRTWFLSFRRKSTLPEMQRVSFKEVPWIDPFTIGCTVFFGLAAACIVYVAVGLTLQALGVRVGREKPVPPAPRVQKAKLPVKVTFRPSIGRGSLVAQYRNESAKPLKVSVSLKNIPLGQTQTLTLDLPSGGTVEHGWAEGWSYKSGETISISHPEFEGLEVTVP